MDACMSYLSQIDVLMESYVELPTYAEVFEAADEGVAAITAKNAEVEEKSLTLLQKAAAAIRAIFNRIREILHTVVQWVKADSKELTQFKVFQKECKENPEFAKMQVTLEDYREINAEYDKHLSHYEREYRQLKDEEIEKKPNFLKDIQDGLDNIARRGADMGKKWVLSITVEKALDYCRESQKNAIKIQRFIDNDMLILDALEKELGKKEIRKFKRKVKFLQSRFKFVRALAGGRKKQSEGLQRNLNGALQKLGQLFKAKGLANRAGVSNTDFVRGVAKGVKFKHDINRYSKNDAKENKRLAQAARDTVLDDNKRLLGKGAGLGDTEKADDINARNAKIDNAIESNPELKRALGQ